MLLPSDIARLVLGYLQQERLTATCRAFISESPDLKEYAEHSTEDGAIPACVFSLFGKNLNTILNEYVAIKAKECSQESQVPAMMTSLWRKLDFTLNQIRGRDSPLQVVVPDRRFSPGQLSPGRRKCDSPRRRGGLLAGQGGAPRTPQISTVIVETEEFQNEGEQEPVSESFPQMVIENARDKILSDKSLQEKLAENINKFLGSENNPQTSKQGASGAVVQDPSIDEILGLQAEIHMTDEAIRDILEQTESDPAFQALFDLFDYGKNRSSEPGVQGGAGPISVDQSAAPAEAQESEPSESLSEPGDQGAGCKDSVSVMVPTPRTPKTKSDSGPRSKKSRKTAHPLPCVSRVLLASSSPHGNGELLLAARPTACGVGQPENRATASRHKQTSASHHCGAAVEACRGKDSNSSLLTADKDGASSSLAEEEGMDIDLQLETDASPEHVSQPSPLQPPDQEHLQKGSTDPSPVQINAPLPSCDRAQSEMRRQEATGTQNSPPEPLRSSQDHGLADKQMTVSPSEGPFAGAVQTDGGEPSNTAPDQISAGSALFISSPVQPVLQSMVVPVSVVGQSTSGSFSVAHSQMPLSVRPAVNCAFKVKLKPKLAPKASTDIGKSGPPVSDQGTDATGLQKQNPVPLQPRLKPAGPSQHAAATEVPSSSPPPASGSNPMSGQSHRRVLCFDLTAPERCLGTTPAPVQTRSSGDTSASMEAPVVVTPTVFTAASSSAEQPKTKGPSCKPCDSVQPQAVGTGAAAVSRDGAAPRPDATTCSDRGNTSAPMKELERSRPPLSTDSSKGAPLQTESEHRQNPHGSSGDEAAAKQESSGRSLDSRNKSQTSDNKEEQGGTESKRDSAHSGKAAAADPRLKSNVSGTRKEADQGARGREGLAETRGSSQDTAHVAADKENKLEGRNQERQPAAALPPGEPAGAHASQLNSIRHPNKTSPLTKQAAEMLQDIQGHIPTATPSKSPELPLPRTPGSGRHPEEPLDCLRTPVRPRQGRDGDGTPRHLVCSSPPGQKDQQCSLSSSSKKKAKKQKKLLDSFPDDLDVDKFLSSLHYDE
nr:PREDICTED: protein NPAT [Lepisosteus oculatus]